MPIRPGSSAALWPVGNLVSIADLTNIDDGTIAAYTEAAIGAAAFTGAGLDDATITGNYNGTEDASVRVEVETTGATDTFKVSFDGGSTWTLTAVDMTGAAQHVGNGVLVTWTATTGHTATDRYDFTVTTTSVTVENLAVTGNVYATASILTTALVLRDLQPAVWGQTSAASGVSETTPNRVYIDSPADLGFLTTAYVFIQSVLDGDIYETQRVASVSSTYLDLDTNLVNDYPEGSVLAVIESGQAVTWARAHTTAITAEELKRFRVNLRRL